MKGSAIRQRTFHPKCQWPPGGKQKSLYVEAQGRELGGCLGPGAHMLWITYRWQSTRFPAEPGRGNTSFTTLGNPGGTDPVERGIVSVLCGAPSSRVREKLGPVAFAERGSPWRQQLGQLRGVSAESCRQLPGSSHLPVLLPFS